MKLITHNLPDGTAACVCVSTYDERHIPAQAGFEWARIVPKAWATKRASVAAKLWMHADEITIQRLLKAGVITQDQHDQRITALAESKRFNNPRETKRDRAAELAIRLAGQPALIEAIHFMLRFMAGRCDGAVKEDGIGFNGTDTGFGHELAAAASLSPKQAAWGQILLWKYMGQLGHLPQFNEVYGAEAEAERQRLAEIEQQKQQARMAGKKCKAHGAQITFLGRGKRVGFCDLCKPAEAQPEQQPAAEAPVVVNCANCQQPLAEDDDQLLCPACRGEQQPVHPVDAFVELAEAAGISHLIDPAKVDAARRFLDAEVSEADVVSPMAVCWKCGAALDGGRQCGCPAQDGAAVAVEARQSAPEASADAQAPSKPASGPVREVAGLSVALQPGTDQLWQEVDNRRAALVLLGQARANEGTELITDAMLDDALTKALVIAGRVAKAEAKAGNIITAARR